MFLVLAVIAGVTVEEEKTQIPTTKHTKFEKTMNAPKIPEIPKNRKIPKNSLFF